MLLSAGQHSLVINGYCPLASSSPRRPARTCQQSNAGTDFQQTNRGTDSRCKTNRPPTHRERQTDPERETDRPTERDRLQVQDQQASHPERETDRPRERDLMAAVLTDWVTPVHVMGGGGLLFELPSLL